MSKALVVYGVDFSTNKVKTVTFGNTVPCTALSLSDSTHAFTAIGATKTLTATPTPSNTTDTLSWASSDENVATVADGVVTCVGVGSATITATCGTQTATCAIISTVTVDANTEYTGLDGYSFTSTDLANNKDYIGAAASSRRRMFISETPTETGYKAITNDNSMWDSYYPLMLPKNTTKITLTVPSGFNKRVGIILADSTSKPTYNVSNKGVKAISNTIMNTWTGSERTAEFSLGEYTGYDSFLFYAETASADASTVTGDVSVVFS